MSAPTLRDRIESLAKAMGRNGTNVEYTAQQVSDMLHRELAIPYALTDKAQQEHAK